MLSSGGGFTRHPARAVGHGACYHMCSGPCPQGGGTEPPGLLRSLSGAEQAVVGWGGCLCRGERARRSPGQAWRVLGRQGAAPGEAQTMRGSPSSLWGIGRWGACLPR